MASTVWRRILLIILLVTGVALPVGATTLRVEKEGTGDYTIIQDAVDAAAVGDTILIGPGQYTEHRPFTTDQKTEDAYVAIATDSLTIRGTDRDAVIIGPSERDFTALGPWGVAPSRELSTYVRIENLTVMNVRDGIPAYNEFHVRDVTLRNCWLGLTHYFGSSSTVARSRFEDCSRGVTTGTGVSDFLVDHCVFANSTILGVSISRTSRATVSSCAFSNDRGIQFAEGSTGSILSCEIAGPNTIVSIAVNSTVQMLSCTISSSGINVNVEALSHLEGSGNVLQGGFVRTMYITGGSTADFHGNHILRSGTAPIVETDAYGVEPIQIDLTGNYWGTSNRDSIDAWTLDGEDLDDPPNSRNFSEILFEPFEPAPVTTEQETVSGLKTRYRSPD